MIFSWTGSIFVGGDKLLPVIKHGFLRSEENVFPAIFQYPKCVWENVFLYNSQYMCMVGVYYHICRQMLLPYFYKHTFIVADAIALADVIAMFCVLFLLFRHMFLPQY